jgi:hypothetical protein
MLWARGGRGSIGWVGRVCLGVVLCSPLCGRFICPFDVARLEDKYLAMVLALRCGALFKKPMLIALMREDMGGLHRLWCMDFTALVLVVQCNKRALQIWDWSGEAVGNNFYRGRIMAALIWTLGELRAWRYMLTAVPEP